MQFAKRLLIGNVRYSGDDVLRSWKKAFGNEVIYVVIRFDEVCGNLGLDCIRGYQDFLLDFIKWKLKPGDVFGC